MAINTIFTNYNHSLIGGGKNNSIKNSCAVIVGGANNAVSGAYSVILGGSGNTVSAAYSYAGVFGQNIAAVASNTLHAESLWLKPGSYLTYAGVAPPTTFPMGTIYADSSSGYLLRIQV